MKIFSSGYIDRSEGKKVCGIDLDDVLADSIPSWIGFVNDFDYSSQEYIDIVGEAASRNASEKRIPWARTPYCHLFEMKKTIPYYHYRVLKEFYRQSEVKKRLPIMDGAEGFMKYLSKNGYFIVILTARRERSLKITTDWLSWHNLPYDGIIFDKNKHIRILESFPNMKFMVEDHREIANLISLWGYTAYLIDNIYNQGPVSRNVERVYSPNPFFAIIDHLKKVSKKERQDKNE